MLDTAAVRKDFPILRAQAYGRPLVYLDNAATTQKPKSVLRTIMNFYSASNANIHRGVHYLSERAEAAYEAAREKVRDFIHAEKSREIIFTHSTTDSINMLADAFGRCCLAPGDEILVTGLEHHSNLIPWQSVCKRHEARLKTVPLNAEGLLQAEALQEMIHEKTKLIALTFISNALGLKSPVEDAIRLARARGIPVLIDAAQAVQHTAINVRELDCDFLVFSGHKIYAETGIGVLYGKESWLERLPPSRYGGGMVRSVGPEKTTFDDLPHKFEAGTPNIAGAVSLGAALDYVTRLGLSDIALQERSLVERTVEKLREIDGMTIYGNDAPRCSLVSFNLDHISAFDVALILDQMGVAVRSGTHCAEPLMRHFGVPGMVRASFALYNTKEEVDQLIEGVQKAGELLRT